MTAPRRGAARRTVVLAALALAVLVLATAAATWVSGAAPTVVGTEEVAVPGTAAAPAVPAAAVVVGAAALALGIGRRVAAVLGGLVLVAAAVMVVGAVVGFLAAPEPALLGAAADLTGIRELAEDAAVTVWPWVTAALGTGVAAVGVLALVSSGGWQRAGRRFERADAPRPATDPRTRAMDDWDALGRGEDPTQP